MGREVPSGSFSSVRWTDWTDLEIHGIAAVADHKIRRKLFQESLDFLGSLEGFTGSEKEGISKIFFHIPYFMDVHLLQALFCPEIQVLFLNF